MLALCCTTLLGLALANAGADTAFAQGSPALNSKGVDVGALLSNVQRNGFVRVIVLFESPVPVNEIKADPASIADVTTRVGAIQDAIIASHLAGAPTSNAGTAFNRGIVRFPITPGFAANVNERELDALAADPRIVTIQYDRADPPTLLQSVALIGGTTAYANGATGAGWAVAVLDTGVQSNHELLSGKVIAEACFSNSGGSGGQTTLCPNGTATQTGAGAASPIGPCLNGASNICEHGTHVAGIAAGLNTSQTSGEPTNGVGRDAKVFAVQVFTRFNDTGNCGAGNAPCVLAFTSDQISALNHVFANLTLTGGVLVASVNMSLGGGLNSSTCDSDTRKPAIDNLRGAGVLTAIASGNNGSRTQISAPGCISTALTVGSTTKVDAVSSFSNMSAVVDVLAPGGESGGTCAFGANNIGILSSVAASPLSTGSYACFVGTSMATPHVAGAIAALRTACPTATATEIETALKNTGLSVTDGRSSGVQTKPRIRVDLAHSACASPPANDNFASAATIALNSLVVGTNLGATKESGEPNHGGSTGGRSVWWNFTAPKTGRFVVSTAGSNFDTLLGIYTGGTVNALTTIAGNDDCVATNRLHSCVSFAGIAGTVYRIAVDGFIAASGNINLIVTAPLVTADFGGDSRSDILWRHDTSPVAMWQMGGYLSISRAGVTNSVPNDWAIIAEDDFDGDGKSDILWRNVSGPVVLWQMNGAAPTATPTVTNTIGPEWAIVGTCDFNADGKADILWRHTGGTVAMWLMNGATPVLQTGVTSAIGNDWKIVGLGDFNGDGRCDILWRHDTGPVAMWLMNGATPILTVGVTSAIGNEWKIIGTRDFNGDGKADILWRLDSGPVAMWIMNGNVPYTTTGVTGSIPNEWQIVALGDFGGDSNYDLLWRHIPSGQVAMWQMQGATPLAQSTVTTDIGPDWKILGVTTTLAVPASK
jgi:hypothetical protein